MVLIVDIDNTLYDSLSRIRSFDSSFDPDLVDDYSLPTSILAYFSRLDFYTDAKFVNKKVLALCKEFNNCLHQDIVFISELFGSTEGERGLNKRLKFALINSLIEQGVFSFPSKISFVGLSPELDEVGFKVELERALSSTGVIPSIFTESLYAIDDSPRRVSLYKHFGVKLGLVAHEYNKRDYGKAEFLLLPNYKL